MDDSFTPNWCCMVYKDGCISTVMNKGPGRWWIVNGAWATGAIDEKDVRNHSGQTVHYFTESQCTELDTMKHNTYQSIITKAQSFFNWTQQINNERIYRLVADQHDRDRELVMLIRSGVITTPMASIAVNPQSVKVNINSLYGKYATDIEPITHANQSTVSVLLEDI